MVRLVVVCVAWMMHGAPDIPNSGLPWLPAQGDTAWSAIGTYVNTHEIFTTLAAVTPRRWRASEWLDLYYTLHCQLRYRMFFSLVIASILYFFFKLFKIFGSTSRNALSHIRRVWNDAACDAGLLTSASSTCTTCTNPTWPSNSTSSTLWFAANTTTTLPQTYLPQIGSSTQQNTQRTNKHLNLILAGQKLYFIFYVCNFRTFC